MTRREWCRAGLRLAALGGLLVAGASLVNGRGEAAAGRAPCGKASGCPRCPQRRRCPAAPDQEASANLAPSQREGQR
jgi:hypothetical protein